MSHATILSASALVLGHDVNTDELHPSAFYSLNDQRVAQGFLGAVAGRSAIKDDPGSRIVIAGRNFGCGSSRETGARVFTLVGVQAVVAASYARIFYRNLINLGLPAFICPSLAEGALEMIEEGAEASIDMSTQQLVSNNQSWPLTPMDPLHAAILKDGGLLQHLGLNP